MVTIDLSKEEIDYIKNAILKSQSYYGGFLIDHKTNELKKNIVIPDPTIRKPDEKIVDIRAVPTYQSPINVQSTHIAPDAVVGTPKVESDDDPRKQLIEKLMKKAESCGYVFKEEGGFMGSGSLSGQMEG